MNLQLRIKKMQEQGMEKEQVLQKLADEGYIFHGSDQKIKILKPNKVNQKGSDKSDLLKISATSTPSYAMFFALTSRRASGYTSVRYEKGKHIFSAEEGPYNAIEKGFVHIMKGPKLGGKFKEIDLTEFISSEQAEVIAIMEIEPKDFKHKIRIIE